MSWEIIFIISAILILPVFIYGSICQFSVIKTFNRYNKYLSQSGITGGELAKRLLTLADLSDIKVAVINGKLTDNYNPKYKVIKLSNETYYSSSVAALGVVAHEVGHAIQDRNKNPLFRLRLFVVPIVNLFSRSFFFLIIFGSFLGMIYYYTAGYYILIFGVITYGLSLLFSMITLPLEFDASNKALKMLTENNILNNTEVVYTREVLRAAAQTYVADLLSSLLYFLRFLSLAMIFVRDRK